MRRSTDRILTTHVGNLPLLDKTPDLRQSVRAIVDKLGMDVINEGGYAKGGDWLFFVESRFGGFEGRPRPADELPLIAQGKDLYSYRERARNAVLCTGRANSHTRSLLGLHRPCGVCSPGRSHRRK